MDDFSTKTIQQIVETFVNPARMTKSQNMAMKKFMRNSGDELKGTETEKMMQKVFKLGDIKRVDLKIGLVQAPADQVGADEVLAVVGLMTIVHNVACTLLVVRVEMKSPSNCLANRVVRADIKKCVTSGIQQCDEGLVSIETQANILIAAESVHDLLAMRSRSGGLVADRGKALPKVQPLLQRCGFLECLGSQAFVGACVQRSAVEGGGCSVAEHFAIGLTCCRVIA